MDVVIPTNLVCVLFDNAILTLFFNFIVFILALLLFLQVAHLGSSTACMHVASKGVKGYHMNAHSMVVHILRSRVEKKPLSFHDH